MKYANPPDNLPILPRLGTFTPSQSLINEFRTTLELEGKDTSSKSDDELKNIIIEMTTLFWMLKRYT